MSYNADHGFYAQRVQKELRAKNHFDKVVHLHQQRKMASSYASGFSSVSASSLANTDIMRNRSFANQMTVTNAKQQRPNYFLNTSNGIQASNPNTLRDMGGLRNCEYHVGDDIDDVQKVTWRDLVADDQALQNQRSYLESASKHSHRSRHSQSRKQASTSQGRREKLQTTPVNQTHTTAVRRSDFDKTQQSQKSHKKDDFNDRRLNKVDSKTSRLFKYLTDMKNNECGNSTVSRDSKISTKSRLFNMQRSRQKWKDQMYRDHQSQKELHKVTQDTVQEDVEVEDFVDDELSGKMAIKPMYSAQRQQISRPKPSHLKNEDARSNASSQGSRAGRENRDPNLVQRKSDSAQGLYLTVDSFGKNDKNLYQLGTPNSQSRRAGVPTMKIPGSIHNTGRSADWYGETLSRGNSRQFGSSTRNSNKSRGQQQPPVILKADRLGTRVMGNIKNNSQTIFCPGQTVNQLSSPKVKQTKTVPHKQPAVVNRAEYDQVKQERNMARKPFAPMGSSDRKQRQYQQRPETESVAMSQASSQRPASAYVVFGRGSRNNNNKATSMQRATSQGSLTRSTFSKMPPATRDDALKEYFIAQEQNMQRRPFSSSSQGSRFRQ